MTVRPEIGSSALLVVDVVGEELDADGGTTSLLVECPNGTTTIAAPGHVLALHPADLVAIGRLVKEVGRLASQRYLYEPDGEDGPGHVCGVDPTDAVRELQAMTQLVYRMGW